MSSGGYPLGAANDPRAPYNQEERTTEVEVTVSITLSKTFTMEVPDYGHAEKDEDGAYWESEYGPITEEDVRREMYLPDDILNMFADSMHKNATDADGWNVDDLAIISE